MTEKLFDNDDIADDLNDNDDTSAVTIPDDKPLSPFLEKYKDEKGVAKAIVEKDSFIRRLQSETAGLRAEIASRGRVEDIVDRLLSSQNTTSRQPAGGTTNAAGTGANDGGEAPPNTQTSGLTEQDVLNLLARKEAEVISAANLRRTKEMLTEKFGDEWVAIIKKKAKEIGETPEFFDAIAKKNPQAVIALVSGESGAQTKPPQQTSALFNNTAATATPQNTTARVLGSNARTNYGARTAAYYGKMKKDNPTVYWSPKIQNQMHNDALAQGPDFFDT